MSDSVQPHRWQPTRLPCPWDSPGKNTGVGCLFLLQCRKVESESEVPQSRLTLSDPMDCLLIEAVCMLSCAQVFAAPWTVACQDPLSVGFCRQEYWSGLTCSIPGDLPNSGTAPTSPVSPALARGFFAAPPPGKPLIAHL